MALLDDPQVTCNRNFTQYRRLRYWDEKVRLGTSMARLLLAKWLRHMFCFQTINLASNQSVAPAYQELNGGHFKIYINAA